ncbi:MAG: ABC transporter ATP-binding protein [Oscillospiraceae bacterium]|nr:ABC transporter ATP-binding protein [Oscillospiraceae bacterium]
MKLIFRYLGRYKAAVALSIFIKLLGTLSELMLPYILEYIIDDVVPSGVLTQVLLWGVLMFAAAFLCRQLNVAANRCAIGNAHRISYEIRQELFEKTANLSGAQFDAFGLPSLISRMTSDSYNVQSAVQQFQTMCVRAPILLLGGVAVAMLMDLRLSMILVIMLPFLIAVVLAVSARGIPMYTRVQQRLDIVVRIMRENITGIRVVKALSKEDYERLRFGEANRAMTERDIAAATVMAVPGPFMQLCLNIGLTLVVLFGARRVDAGQIKPGVILAFLTYFNMISMGVMGLTRIFMTLSKASASADRIDAVLSSDTTARVLPETEAQATAGDEFIRFEHVDFSYDAGSDTADFAGGAAREKALSDISFSLRRGESLGIIGPTGCGKTTIVNLLMRFYEPQSGSVFVGGKDVRCYAPDALRRRFGAAFQNDMVFRDTLRENVSFGRELGEDEIRSALDDAMASEFVDALPGGLDFAAAIKGANLSGGQKQRLLVARALAGSPEILVLDDSSSALDYKTDARMRRAIFADHPEATVILIAQRVSSVMGMTKILALDNGKCVGCGTHEELLERCPSYRETYQIQMGEMG